jgi:hypothetical protein
MKNQATMRASYPHYVNFMNMHNTMSAEELHVDSQAITRTFASGYLSRAKI